MDGEVHDPRNRRHRLGKNVFAIHSVDAAGKCALARPSVARDKQFEPVVSLPPCLIDMEACSGGHHWARELQKHAMSDLVRQGVVRAAEWEESQV